MATNTQPTDIQARPSPVDAGGELGITLNLPFSSYLDEVPNPSESDITDLLERLDQAQRNDGHMRALYRLLTLPLRRTKWSVRPGDDDGENEANLIEAMFTKPPHAGGMSTSFDYVRAMLGKAVVNGFQVFEEVYQIADYSDVGGPSEAIVLRKLAPRDCDTVKFKADDHGGFDGVVQRAYGKDGYIEITIPPEKVWFWTVDKEDHPFYGRSMFMPALYHSDKKRKLYYIAHIAAQFGAVPGRLGIMDNADLTPTQKTAFRQALADFGFNTAMVVPSGTRVEAFQGGGMSAELLNLINHHNIQASQSVLAQFIDLSVSTGSGSRSLSEDFSAIFLLTLEALLDSIALHINHYLIPKFVEWNFPGSTSFPEFTFDPLSDEMREAMVTVFTSISTSATNNTTPEFLFELEQAIAERFGLPVEYDELEDEVEKRRMVADAQEEAALMKAEADAENAKNPQPEPAFGGKGFGATEIVASVNLAESQTKLLAEFSEVVEIGPGAGRGDREAFGPYVIEIRERLAQAGIEIGDDGEGVYGRNTSKAVREYQTINGLDPTGTVDLSTYALLIEES